MHQDQRRCPFQNRRTHHFSGMYGNRVDTSPLLHFFADNPVFGIKKNHAEFFPVFVTGSRAAVFDNCVVTGQNRRFGRAQFLPGHSQRRLAHNPEHENCILLQTGKSHQFVVRSKQDFGKTAEFLNQRFCQRFGIFSRDRQRQQQFQHLIIRHVSSAAEFESLFQPLTVTYVIREFLAHACPYLYGGLSRPFGE